MKDNTLELINSLQVTIEEANYVIASEIWEDFVGFWQYNRLYYITDGSAELYLKDKIIHLEAGKLYFIPPYSVIGGKCKIFGHYFCHFRINSPFETLNDFITFDDVLEANSFDEQLFITLTENFPANTPQKTFALKGAFNLLFSKFLATAKPKNNKAEEFTDVIKYISDNACNDISLQDIASKSKYHTTYFCAVFKDTFGISPWNYLIKCRLEISATLITTTTLTIKQIAEKVGFADEFYFSRVFKKRYGVSPKKYRKNYRDLIIKSNSQLLATKKRQTI